MLRINRTRLRESHETPWLILDLVMLGLLLINLAWLVFDALYATTSMQYLLDRYWPSLLYAYAPVHKNFLLIDLGFIAIFFVEFCVRWAVSLARKEHLRWYFFPVLHWYDIVGLIPLGATRLFRFLRIFSILHRLHKQQIVDLNNTRIYRFFAFYYDVFVEELSDRIVVKVLSDIQKDVANGSPLIDKITHQVLSPRQPVLARWMAGVMQHMGDKLADDEQGGVIREHVRQSVGKAVKDNPQLGNLHYLPVIGKTIESTLEQTITDIVTASLVNLLHDVDDKRINQFVEASVDGYKPDNDNLDKEVLQVINECFELVKGHVRQQRWKTTLANRGHVVPTPQNTDTR
ncbi:ion transporter [Salinimonas lutimaris]|uniref:ion transporter n=1 Tax=Salinimonas lutimaris TaxID=914153 RepID=UPI0010C0EA27|nr:ion transporter [Salinimonas lutimaris]